MRTMLRESQSSIPRPHTLTLNTLTALPDDCAMQQLLALLRVHLSVLDVTGLTLQTSLNHDLGCDGDDAAEFMADMADRASIDFIDYDAYRYFTPEGYDFSKWLRQRDRRGRVALTLAMLHHAIAHQRWQTSEVESLNAPSESNH